MNKDAFAAFDATRDFSKKAVEALCYAPFTNLWFDRRGDAMVCCWSWRFPVGNVLKDTMDEIWHGPRIQELRAKLSNYEFVKACDFCRFQTEEGVYDGAKMRQFDRFDVAGADPEWPRQIEFSISNSCNLECVMCDGFHSSAIRAHRDKLPAMPRLYSDEFLDSVRKYLPHLAQAKFLGGEPFLVTEHFRIWDMMVEDGLSTRCHVTTNGTQYNDRIEAMLEKLPFGFSISLDAATKKTYESIRVNAVFEEVVRNAKRFRDYSKEKHTSFSFTYCLMRQNWREFGPLCLMADEWGAAVGINTVRNPPEMGIYTMSDEGLREVLEGMERQAPELESKLKANKPVWFGELARIRAKVASGSRAAA
jgi:MoaA/NifB/PqqE/SkfB family radical SAM enzyme